MKMQNTEMEFVSFDVQDVIATSNIGTPIAFAKGSAISGVENFYNGGDKYAVDVLGYDSQHPLHTIPQWNSDNYYAIINAMKGDNGYYGITIDDSKNYGTEAPTTDVTVITSSSGEYIFLWLRDVYFNQ